MSDQRMSRIHMTWNRVHKDEVCQNQNLEEFARQEIEPSLLPTLVSPPSHLRYPEEVLLRSVLLD